MKNGSFKTIVLKETFHQKKLEQGLFQLNNYVPMQDDKGLTQRQTSKCDKIGISDENLPF